MFSVIRYCTSCSVKQRKSANFCWKCGSPVQCGLSVDKASTSQSGKLSFGKPVQNQPKSFDDHMNYKKQQHQFRPRKKSKVSPDENVIMSVGLMRMRT